MNQESIPTKLAVIKRDMNYLKEKVDHIDEQVSDNYVTKAEFQPVQKVVYGLVGLILVTVVGAVLALVLVK